MIIVIQLIVRKTLESKAVLSNLITKVKSEDKGATAVEYALIVGLIAVVIIAAVTLLGTQIRDIFTSITNAL